MIINGEERLASEKFEDRSPTNTDQVLGIFQKGTADDANDAIAAAREAFPVWSGMPWQERVRLMRKAADIIDRRTIEIGAVLALEVGKNRLEALGDIAENNLNRINIATFFQQGWKNLDPASCVATADDFEFQRTRLPFAYCL